MSVAKAPSQGPSTSVSKGKFSAGGSNLMTAAADAPKVSQVHKHKKQGKLRFVVGFAAGAKLRLDVEGPGGQKFDRTDTETFTIEVPDAAAGDWHCTITALHVPYDNFPFSFTVADEKK